MRREPVISLLLLSLLPLLPSGTIADTLAENQARFGVITGDVGLLSQGATEWIEPHEGLPLDPGDRIRTGEDGRVEFAMSENVLWTLEPESEVVTEHMETNAGRMNLTSGSLLGVVDSARAAGTVQSWVFNTPAFVVAIRGTEFALEFSKGKPGRLGVFEGVVELQPAETAAGPLSPVRVSAGQEAVAARGKPLLMLAKFSPGMQALSALRSRLKARQRQIHDTWSPFTPAVRHDARSKFVAPPPKRRVRRSVGRPPKPAVPQ